METLYSLLDFFAQCCEALGRYLPPVFQVGKVPFPKEIQTHVFQ